MKKRVVIVALVSGVFFLAVACRPERDVQPVQAPPVTVDPVVDNVRAACCPPVASVEYAVEYVYTIPELPVQAPPAVTAPAPVVVPVQAPPPPPPAAATEVAEPVVPPAIATYDADAAWALEIQARALEHDRRMADPTVPAAGAAMQALDFMNRVFGQDD